MWQKCWEDRTGTGEEGATRARYVYCLGEEGTSTDWLANGMQLSPGLAMQLKAGL